MVHALNELYRVLRSEGTLVDLRPVASDPPLEIVTADRAQSAGNLCHDADRPDDLAADAAIQAVVDDTLFTPLRTEAFGLAAYWDSLEHLLEYAVENWSDPDKLSDELIGRAMELEGRAGSSYRVRIRSQMHLAQYRKC